MMVINQNELYHYGVKRRSGRYPYGSGERPYQGESGRSRINRLLYQNKDGSLNTIGRMKYGTTKNFNKVIKANENARKKLKMSKANARTQKEIDKINKRVEDKIKPKKEKKTVDVEKKSPPPVQNKPKIIDTSKRKKLNEMTDEELKARIARLDLENAYVSKLPKQKSVGEKVFKIVNSPIVRDVVGDFTDPVGKAFAKKLNKQMGLETQKAERDKEKEKRRPE